MPIEYIGQCGHIFGSFQSVEVIRMLAKLQARRSKNIQPLLISQPYPPPVVALQQDDRTIEVKSFDRKKVTATPPQFPGIVQHSAAALDLRIATISQPPSRIDPYSKIANSMKPPNRGTCVSLLTRRVEDAEKEPVIRFFKNCSR